MRQGEGAALDSNEGELKKPLLEGATPPRHRGTKSKRLPFFCFLVLFFYFNFHIWAAAARQTVVVVSGRRDTHWLLRD